MARLMLAAKRQECLGIETRAKAQFQPAIAQHIQHGRIFGQAQRHFLGQHDNPGAQADMSRALGDGCQ